MVEIPLHSRVQSHASAPRAGGGGLSGFKMWVQCAKLLRWYCKTELLWSKNRKTGWAEKERKQRRWWGQEQGRKVRSISGRGVMAWVGGFAAQVVKYQSRGCSSNAIKHCMYLYFYMFLCIRSSISLKNIFDLMVYESSKVPNVYSEVSKGDEFWIFWSYIINVGNSCVYHSASLFS